MSARCSLLIVLIAAAAIFGCGGEDSEPSPEQAQTAPSRTSETQDRIQLDKVDGRLGGAVTADAGDQREDDLGGAGPIPDDLAEPPSDDTGVAAGAPCPDPELSPTADNLARIRAATLCLMNAQRRKHGLPPLASSAVLARASLGHSTDMVRRAYFSHATPEGKSVVDRLRAARYISKPRGWTVGENIAWGSGPLGSPRAIVQAWMDSPGHRENLLSPRYSAVGLGIAFGRPGDPSSGATFTTCFGRRA
jgi:uncharacterized protein YkwD